MKLRLLLSCILFFSVSAVYTQCLEITSIFVDACDGDSDEGENEMVFFEVGATTLPINDIVANWPNNPFLGWCQNAGTAASTAALNTTILTSCGFLIEPPTGVLPAGAKVITIASENFSLIDNSFEGLSDTVYIIYQCSGNTQGHFANAGSGFRDLTFTTVNSCIGSEFVQYDRSMLFGGNGATVNFDAAGNDTYVNNGCNAPVPFFSAAWTFTEEICDDYGTLNLNILLSSGTDTNGTWSGPNVTDSIYDPSGHSGIDSITYLVTGTGACPIIVDSTIIFNVSMNQSVSTTIQACDSVFANGQWFNSDTTITVLTPPTDMYGCDSTTVLTLLVGTEIMDSSYLTGCAPVSFGGTDYNMSTTLRDTIPGIPTAGSSCDELFISEYIEGSSNNKALEIYNGTGVPVNLTNYTLERYTNGSGTPVVIGLSGIIADGDVYVIVNNNANPTFQAAADLSVNALNHNGNDAYMLKNTSAIIDIFGNPGCDPGTQWTELGNGTQNNGYQRQANYTDGVLVDPPNAPCSFPSMNAMNWISYDVIDMQTLGTHTANCSGGVGTSCDTIVITEIVVIQETVIDTSVEICDGASYFAGGANQTMAGLYSDTIVGMTGGMGTDTFYTETFDGPLTWNLNTPTGTNGPDNNFWQIDDDEGGVAPMGCGIANNGNNTLHITSAIFPTFGAAYDAGGFCGLLSCPETNQAATSANISTVGRTNIAFGFDFIANGDGLTDNASVLYSIDGGGSFITLDASIKSTLCVSGQGEWTAATYALPATAENIPNLQLRFNWTNNDDGVGTDPSVAINDIYLTSQSMGTASCDTIINTTLSVSTATTNNQAMMACDSVVFNGTTYTMNTTVTDTTMSASGCDSIYLVTSITVNTGDSILNPANPITFCTGDSAQLPDMTFVTADGTYFSSFLNANGCDSIVESIVQTMSCGCTLTDDMTLWVKADSLVSNGGLPISVGPADLWGNLITNPAVPSLNGLGGTRNVVTNDPTFNFNSSMDLGNAFFSRDGLQNNAVLDPTQGSMFVVATQAGLSMDFVVTTGGTGVCGGNRCNTGFRGNRSEYGGANGANYTGATNAGIANVMSMSSNIGTSTHRNAINGTEATGVGGINIPVATATVTYGMRLGNFPGFSMTGKISEAIAFDRELTPSEFQVISSYLGMKYGVTLAHNYFASNWDGAMGTTVWTTGGGYDSDIASIGRDDCLGLNQIISHSVNPNAIVTVALTDMGGTITAPNDFNNNLEFLTWGNNAGTTDFGCSSNVPTGFNQLYSREWLVQESGTIGSIAMAFDQANANISGLTNVALVIDTDLDGLYSDETEITGTVLAGNLIFNNIDFSSGQTFTLVHNSDTTVMVADSICSGTMYTLPGGSMVSMAGVYNDTLTGVQFCDSIVVTTLSILNASTSNEMISICNGDSLLVGGAFQTATGAYLDTFMLASGCDSIHTTNLTVEPLITGSTSINICIGDSLFVGGAFQTTAGNYIDTLMASNTCDSVFTTTLGFIQIMNETLPNVAICAGETSSIFGNLESTAGTYTDTLQSAAGCDSLIQTVLLIVNPTTSDTLSPILCEGDSLLAGGAFQTVSGTYIDTLTDINGCDLLQITELTFEPSPTAFAGNDTTINLGEDVIITASGGVNYEWNTGEFGPSILVQPIEETTYSVTVTGNGSCPDIDSITVFVDNIEVIILIPNAFSPNDDAVNNIFEIVNKEDFEEIELRVYNRWGEIIHFGTGSNHGWDGSYKGKTQPIGVYSYAITVKRNAGSTEMKEFGNVTLIR